MYFRRKIPPSMYAPASPYMIETQLRRGQVPTAFERRMRVINILSATTLMKIEDKFLKPFGVLDIHHILDLQISQDAIIDRLDNDEISFALMTGNLRPLWEIAPNNPLLLKGFTSGWINKFFHEPFDPLCVMLSMRCRVMLDLVDEEGHSYNLIRSIGYGFIDFGDIPDELPGDPSDYYPPEIDNPITVPPDGGGATEGGGDSDVDGGEAPAPGDADYVPVPGDADYDNPMPGDPDYYIPGPGEDGYLPRPGDPGYVEPGTTPDTNDGGGGQGAIPNVLNPDPTVPDGSPDGGTSDPSTFDDCCESTEDPLLSVKIGYTTQQMAVSETQSLSISFRNPACLSSNYSWKLTAGGGTLDVIGADPPVFIYGPEESEYDPEASIKALSVLYTAPDTNPQCEMNPTIVLSCGGAIVDFLTI